MRFRGGISLLVAACFCASLAGCRREPAAEAPIDGADSANAPTEPLPDADINASLEEDLGAPPPTAETLRFLGRWAVDEENCADNAWRFEETELRTPAGSVCRFSEVRTVPGGYDIGARCTAEGPEQDNVLKLRFAESAGGMLFESDSIADAGLVRCGD